MSEPMSPAEFLQALRDEGLTVVEVGDWRTHNRNHKGPFGPVHGVMIHHTVTQGTARTVEICRHGYASLPGPLCHGVIAKDGRVHLVGYGRTNHAGLGDDDVLQAVVDEKALPADNEANTDGNRYFYGFECENLGDGKDPWPDVQLEAIERAAAAVCRYHRWGAESVVGHLEWQPGKIDPRGFAMASMRARVDERLDDSKPSPTAPAKPTAPVKRAPAFPGRSAFRIGARNKHALQLQEWLHKGDWGPRYKVGPSMLMTQKDLDKVAALQRHYLSALGPADGGVGPKTWQYAFEVANGLRKK
ncbi:N-acetylmuramoyl-L-alanine amidase [Streptomyces sp. NPDC058620]|uniref:N-acetylmuramoyl-L-alanine amidase n=1 Tax=Streptomyces sp. NPDC058620 TaxID=3346560 RepID=UPI00364FD5FF